MGVPRMEIRPTAWTSCSWMALQGQLAPQIVKKISKFQNFQIEGDFWRRQGQQSDNEGDAKRNLNGFSYI
jgi:hypothetical protein